jgi:DNA mismatch repair protein MutS2
VRLAQWAAAALELDAVLEIVAAQASSSLGKRVVLELEPRTESDAAAALERVREVAALARGGLEPSFAGVTDTRALLGGGARALDATRLLLVRGFCEAVGRMAEWFEPRGEEVPSLASLASALPDLHALEEAIATVLDERGKVRDHASDLLQRLRREAAQLSERIDRELRELFSSAELRTHLSDTNVHRRGGRPVLAVKARSAGRVRGIVHDRSQSDATVFVEPQAVVALGNRLAEAVADAEREIERILLDLSRHVLAQSPRIEQATVLVGEIELAFTAARWARANDARAALLPGVDRERGAADELVLRGARHPLLLREVALGHIPEVVPIDLRLGGEFDMLILTGPNTGGKTLALKTVGLFALMTRSGLPIPSSQGTTVPLYDGVVADIGDEQEISQNLSTFASHLVRIKDGLARATSRTLVLLDELGGGTDPDEGAALGEAVLERFLERRAPTIVSTHLGKLKEFAFRHARAENACTEFDTQTLAPRYKLLIGTPGESGALVVAKRLGIPGDVVQRAHERLERRDGELLRLMEDVRHARTAAESVRSQAEERLEEASRTARATQEKAEALVRREELLEAEAQRGLEERVRDALRQLEIAKSLLAQLPQEAAAKLGERLALLERDLTGAALSDRRAAFLDGLAKGKLVYLPRYRQRVVVQRVDRTKRAITVQLGAMKMSVPFEEVTWYESL